MSYGVDHRIRTAARRAFGPAAVLLRAELAALAAELATDEVVEAVLTVSDGPRGRWNEPLAAATDRRLLVVTSGGPVRALEWRDVHGVDVRGRRAVLRTVGGDLATSWPPRSWELSVVADRAAGNGRAVALRDRCDTVFGRWSWLHTDELVRVLDELGPNEEVAGLVASASMNGLVVLTDRRIGLVPGSRRPASHWVALADVTGVRCDGSDLVLGTDDGTVGWTDLEPRALVPGLGSAVAAGAGVPLRLPTLDGEDPDDGCDDGWDDDWDDDWDCECCGGDAAGGWPLPPDDAVARRLEAFAVDLGERLDGVATVEREHPGWVTVRPASPVAAPVTWADSGQDLMVEVDWGRAGVLHLERDDVGDLEAAVRAVVAGRTGRRRGRAVLRLDDGRVVRLGRVSRRHPAYLPYAHDAAERLRARTPGGTTEGRAPSARPSGSC